MDLTSAAGPRLNSDAPWDLFDSRSYLDHNYAALRPDDKKIMEVVRDFFSDHFRNGAGTRVSGIDVGAGTNLYPALAMLPWAETITLCERSAANVRWLEEQIKAYDENWSAFWEVFRADEEYDRISDPRATLSRLAVVKHGDVFDLPQQEWGMGTMFFVAESLSTSHEEFRQAVAAFVESLVPGAPFAAAFMENSHGYAVGEQEFPACPVVESDVREALEPHLGTEGDLGITWFPPEGPHLREGYTGMILACGQLAS